MSVPWLVCFAEDFRDVRATDSVFGGLGHRRIWGFKVILGYLSISELWIGGANIAEYAPNPFALFRT